MTTDTSAATSPSRGMPRLIQTFINLGSIGKTESDLYDIKIEASGLVKLRDKANRTITYCSPGAWNNVRINDRHD